MTLPNTIYIDAALNHLRHQGHPVDDNDIARLSPLQEQHINVHGRYTFIPAESNAPLRPLRDPTTPADE